jgi:hypothetical protein
VPVTEGIDGTDRGHRIVLGGNKKIHLKIYMDLNF